MTKFNYNSYDGSESYVFHLFTSLFMIFTVCLCVLRYNCFVVTSHHYGLVSYSMPINAIILFHSQVNHASFI